MLRCPLWCGVAVLLMTLQDQPLFRSRADLVVVHALVEDARGRAVLDLRREDFQVFEDDRPQTIRVFEAGDVPASVGLLIDNSTSMAPRRDAVALAALTFAELSGADDEVFVLAFNETVTVAWPRRTVGTSDRRLLRDALEQSIAGLGQTALYDAVIAGLDQLDRGRHARRVLVLIGDGDDNASAASLEAMLARVTSTEASIYTVMLRDDGSRGGNPGLMRRLAERSGGEMFSPRRTRDIPAALTQVAQDIRHIYTIGFEPTPGEDGRLRTLRVTARRPGERPLKVKARGGYRAPTPSAPAGVLR